MMDPAETLPPDEPAAAPASPEKKQNIVGRVALGMAVFGYVMFIAIPLPSVPAFVVQVPFVVALLALPVGLVAAILSWVKVFRRKDWWYGIAAITVAYLLVLIVNNMMADAFSTAPVG